MGFFSVGLSMSFADALQLETQVLPNLVHVSNIAACYPISVRFGGRACRLPPNHLIQPSVTPGHSISDRAIPSALGYSDDFNTKLKQQERMETSCPKHIPRSSNCSVAKLVNLPAVSIRRVKKP